MEGVDHTPGRVVIAAATLGELLLVIAAHRITVGSTVTHPHVDVFPLQIVLRAVALQPLHSDGDGTIGCSMSLQMGKVATHSLTRRLNTTGTFDSESHLVFSSIMSEHHAIGLCPRLVVIILPGTCGCRSRCQKDDECQKDFIHTFCHHLSSLVSLFL